MQQSFPVAPLRSKSMKRSINLLIALSLIIFAVCFQPFTVTHAQAQKAASAIAASGYDVRAYGAKGDGKAVDSTAINKAIEAAAANGGGTVFIPAGTYRSYSIRLKSNITLYFDQGATLL